MDSSAFFQYPSGTAFANSGSASNLWFLRNLREDEVRDVWGYTQARRYTGGELAIRQRYTDRGLYVATAGCFEIVEPATDSSRRKTLLQPGDIFGELAFFDHQPRSADLRGRRL